MAKSKLVRITTIPLSLEKLLENQLRFMHQFYEVTAISADENRLKKFGEKEGVNTYSVNLTRRISPLSDLKALWILYLFIRRQKPLIVHTHTPKAGVVGMLASKLAGVPIRLHTVAGLPLMETSGYKKKVLELVEKLTYKCATKVYPNSKGLYEFLVKKKYCSPQKLKVVGGGSSNGIDTGYFDPGGYDNQQRTSLRNKLGILSDEFVFIYVGRLVSNKGINELVKAYLSIFARKKNIKLLLIGPLEKELDPLRPDIERTIKQHPGIISLGYQQDVRLFFFISDALVFPSYREGFPNVVMQAGAMGLPAIVSDINGCNEIVINGENGIVIPPKNSRALSDAMIRIVDDIAFARKMKIKARPMVLGRYDQKEMWNAILTEYKRLESKIVSKGISVTMEGLLCKQIYNRIIKLLVDIAVSLIAFILLFPIFFFTSVLFFLSNKGSVFFLQDRPGRNGKIFKVIKFKTMNDKKDAFGNLLPDASRLTAIGRFVRKTSLDEIPQLLNVIKGDMSLIGPRPLLVEYLPLYNEKQKRRHEVRPGITGWAQVNGRNAISWEQKFEYDVWYVDHVSFALDIKILWMTVMKVFKREGISASGEATMSKFQGTPS